jgi:type IV pilus assembly protein PilA
MTPGKGTGVEGSLMRKRLQRLQERLKSEEGFTLIELMVVVMIIGELIALSVPTFLGAKGRAQDSTAKAAAVRAIQTARIGYTNSVQYSASTAQLAADEPSLTFQVAGTASSGTKDASVTAPTTQQFVAAVWSPSGTCFYAFDDAAVGTKYAKRTGITQSSCTASNYTLATFNGW